MLFIQVESRILDTDRSITPATADCTQTNHAKRHTQRERERESERKKDRNKLQCVVLTDMAWGTPSKCSAGRSSPS